MPRQRLRDWPIKNYQFGCEITGDPPHAVWDCARAMQALWNELVDAHDAARQSCGLSMSREEEESIIAAAETRGVGITELRKEEKARRKAADKDAVRAAYARFIDGAKDAIASKETTAYQIAQNRGAELGLPSGPKWEVYNRFKNALKRWRSSKGEAGPPHKQRRLDAINIPYITQSGGIEIDWLWEGGDRRPIHVRPVAEDAYDTDARANVRRRGTRGRFDVPCIACRTTGAESCEACKGEHSVSVPLEVTLHRPIPDDAILKRVSLCGINNGALGWKWSLLLALEVPPCPVELPATPRAAGLDMGWRKREDGLRLGVLWESSGAREIFLPFNLANRSERKQMERFGETEVTRDIRGVWDLQRAQDEALESVKTQLRAEQKGAWPEDAREAMSGIVKMRAGGLRRLRRMLFDGGVSMDYLDDWYFRHDEIARRIRKAQIRIFATRNAIYRNLAAWIARHYTMIAWESDLRMKDLAENESNEYAIIEAQKHRQFAGLSILRGYVKEKMGERLPKISGKYSTQECSVCGGHIEPGKAMILTCENGHRNDQDINAARVLFGRLPEELRAVAGVPASVDRSQILGNIRPISL